MKEIVFTCVINAANFYHKSEYDIPDFECPKFCFDLDMGIITEFKVIGKLVVNIFTCLGQVICEANPWCLFFCGIIPHTNLT